jgi:hypothetical protein
MYKSIILTSDSRGALERKIEHYANNFIVEHLSFSTITYSNFDVEYVCCLLYRNK